MSDLIVYATTRYRCPHCRRSYAHEKAAAAHEARCFNNPDRRGCRTCKHAEGPDGKHGDRHTPTCGCEDPCDGYAYEAGWIEHSKAQHTSCGDTYTMGAACGGCSDCLSAQAAYWQHRREQEARGE